MSTQTPKEAAAVIALNAAKLVVQSLTTALQAAVTALNDVVVVLPPPLPSAAFTFALGTAPSRKLTFTGVPGMGKYEWNWGDGTSETHSYESASKTFAAAVPVTVTLKVTDASGATNAASQVVLPPPLVVVPPVNPPVVIPPPVTVPPPIAGETRANTPRIYIDSTLPTVTGQSLAAQSAAIFQACLNAAQPGDEIVIDNGITVVGNFTLPVKKSGGWVTIRAANMPPAGRITDKQALALGLPKILSPSNLGAINTDPRSGQWRLIGLDVSVPDSVSLKISNTGLIRLGSGYETSVADLPHDIVIDRCYVHGTPLGNLRRAITLNCIAAAVIDSFIDECHETGTQSQAIAGGNGPGPFLIENCYLAGASENIIFGGQDPTIPGMIPSDITIRRNHITKQLVWAGRNYAIANLLETKNAQRVLIEANVLENNWADAQSGSALNLKSVNQGGTAPWCVSKDITMRKNLFRNTGAGFNLSGFDQTVPGMQNPAPAERLTLEDNIVDGINLGDFLGAGHGLTVNGNPIDILVAHCSFLTPTGYSIGFGGPAGSPPLRFTFRDNVIGNGQYGVKGPGLNAKDSFTAFMLAFRCVGNLFIGSDGVGYPAGNYFPKTRADAVGADLKVTTAYKGKATDGRDPGADVDAVNAAIAGVVIAP